MEYFTASRLGMLQQQLGLGADDRVSCQAPTQDMPSVFVWDLQTGTTYTVTLTPPDLAKGYREVPNTTKNVMAASTDDLKKRWLSTRGWDDDRSSIFSELTIRGVRILDLKPPRPAFDGLP
jgi:hypothetical protein